MRTWLLSVLCFGLAVALSACGGSGAPTAAPEVKTDSPAVSSEETEMAEEVSEPDAALDTPDTPVAATGAPKISSPVPEYDFGEWDNEEKVEYDFVIKNIGGDVLNIKQVRTSCGCTVAQPKKNELAPGEETTVNAVLSLKGRQGAQTKTITVASDDPETPLFQLRMKGIALAAISIEPERVNFGRIETGEIEPQTVKLFSTRDEVSFKVMSIDSSSIPELKTDLRVIEPGKKYEIDISFSERPANGIINGRILIRTDDTKRPMLLVFAHAQFVGNLHIAPQSIIVNYSADPGMVANQAIRVTPGIVKEYNLLEVIPPLDDIEVQVQLLREGDYLLRINNMPRGDQLEGKELILITDIPEEPEVRVPFEIRRPRVAPRGPGAEILRPQPVKPDAPAKTDE